MLPAEALWTLERAGVMTHPQHGTLHHDTEGWWWTPRASGLKRGPFQTAQAAIAEAEKERGDA